MSIFEELKRRKVFRVAATYAVVAWILMQIGEVTFPALNIPEWVMSTLVVVLLAGFPIAVIFAWIFDKTPQGYIKTDAPGTENIAGMNVNVDEKPFYQQKRNIFLVLGVVGGLLLGLFSGKQFNDESLNNDKSFTKMAILPFTNIKQDEANNFLGFALSDEIINRLGYLKSIVVRPSGSVRKYQGTKADLSQVGSELDVELVLTGSYLRDGNQLRLSTELIDLSKNERLWNKTIQVDYDNIFQIQETVSRDIVDGLKYNLEPEEEDNLKSQDVNPIAYELFLRAKDIPESNISSMEARIQLFQQSISIDSTFSESLAELARSSIQMAQASKSGVKYIQLAKSSLDRAVDLNSESLNVINSAAQYYAETGDAEKSTELSIKAMRMYGESANPSWLGYTLRYAGLLNESIAFYDISSVLNNSVKNRGANFIQSGKSSIYLGDISKATKAMHEGIKLLQDRGEKDNLAPVALIYEGIPYLYSNTPKKAHQYFEFISDFDPNNSWSIIGQTYKALNLGEIVKARGLVKVLESRNIHDSEMLYRFTHFYSMLGDSDSALDALERAVDGGFFCFPYIKSDILTKDLHSLPRFKQILEKAKLRYELYEKRFGGEIRALLGMTS